LRIVPLASLATFVVAILSATETRAHHVADGRTPADAIEGLLSGLAHPVIEMDHMAFVLALGVVAGFTQSRMRVPFVFIAGTLVGVGGFLSRLTLPFSESLVALSLVAVGAAFIFRRLPQPRLWLTFAAGAGLVHGYAYGESIAEAEGLVIAAYLCGLAITQTLLALVSKTFVDVMLAEGEMIRNAVRVAGCVLVAMGLVLLSGTLRPA
jgi:urease accessory protein